MTKVMLGVIAGAFLGAFAMEMLERRRPAGARDLKLRTAVRDLREAFLEGFRSTGPDDPDSD